MTELIESKFSLKGRMQIETALGALAYAGMNQDAQTYYRVLLAAHDQYGDDQSQNNFAVYYHDERAVKIKADVATSLDAVIKDNGSVAKELKFAAIALRNTL